MFIAHVIDAVLQLHDQFSGQLRNVSQNLNQFQRQVRYVSKDMKKVDVMYFCNAFSAEDYKKIIAVYEEVTKKVDKVEDVEHKETEHITQ